MNTIKEEEYSQEELMSPSYAEPHIDNIELLAALEEIRTFILDLHTKINELLPKPEL